jgi:hypothetical protein
VNVPGVRLVDALEGILGIEWIEGKSVRKLLPGAVAEEEGESEEEENEEEDPLAGYGVSQGVHACFLLMFGSS